MTAENRDVGGIPKHKTVRFWHRIWFSETIKVSGAVLAAVGTVWIAYIDGKSIQLWLGITTTVLQAGYAVISISAAKAKDNDSTSPSKEMQACVSVVYGAVLARAGISADDEKRLLRCVMHRIVDTDDRYEQATDYVGYDGGKPGRAFPLNKGVVGQCVAKKGLAVYSWNKSSVAELIDTLKGWGYSRREAESMVKMQRSWLAAPIFSSDGSKVIGVIYMDSIDPDFFTDSVQQTVADVCSGIRLHVHRE